MAKKTLRREPVDDKISNLPDDVLIRILSLVPTEQAVTTSLLSKRWKSLWTLLPELDFDYVRFCKSFNIVFEHQKKKRFHGFLDFVYYVFTHHQFKQLHRLRIAFDIVGHQGYTSRLCRLVGFAMRRSCLTLDLQFSILVRRLHPTFHGMYTLPPRKSFPHQSVTHLKLTNCKLTVSMNKSFQSVKIAKLTVVELQKGSVYQLVSKCPCLEELHLIRCKLQCKFPSYALELHSPESNLKCLVLQDCISSRPWPYGTYSHVSVNIPTLLRFKYAGTCWPSINNAENLIEAEIKICYTKGNEQELPCSLLKDLRKVKVLTLCFPYLEVLDTIGGRSLPTPLYNLKHLALTSWRVENVKELSSHMCLLRNSPYLETLSVDFHGRDEGRKDMLSSVYNEVESTILEPLVLPSDCVMHLTKIEITNFQGLKVEIDFVKIMLQSSLCLKEMVICISSRYEHLKQSLGRKHDEVLQKKKEAAVENILACTCLSPDAQILFR